MDHQVVAAGLHRRCRELLGEQVGELGQLGGPVVAVADEVLPAASDRRGDRAHRVEDAGLLVAAEGLDGAAAAAPAAGWSWCRRGRRRTCSPRPAGACRTRAARPRRASSFWVQSESRSTLSVERHRQRVDLVGGHPVDVAVRRLGRELDGTRRHRRGDLRGADRGLGDLDGGRLAEPDAGRESPGAVEDHADREADVLGVRRALQAAVAHLHVLAADPFEAEVRMADVEVLRPGERGLGHPAVGECGERGVDPVRRGHGDRGYAARPRRRASGRARVAAQVRPSRSWASRSAVCSPIHVAGSTSNPAVLAASSTRGSSSTSTTTVRVAASVRRASTL